MNEGVGSGDVKGVCFIFYSFNVKHFGLYFYMYEMCYINKVDLKGSYKEVGGKSISGSMDYHTNIMTCIFVQSYLS